MKSLIVSIIFLISFSTSALTVDFRTLNDAADSQNKDTVVNLGWATSTALCSDPGLTPLIQLKETSSGDIAHCFDYIAGANRGVDLSIPITTRVITDTTIAVQYTLYTEGAGSDFQVFNLKVGRTGSFSGGTPAFGTTFTMVNGDAWEFQLDIRAVIAGPLARSHYVNGIIISITPL